MKTKAEKLASELGYTEFIDALKHARKMRSALRVIHTWAKFDGALDPLIVIELCERALKVKK